MEILLGIIILIGVCSFFVEKVTILLEKLNPFIHNDNQSPNGKVIEFNARIDTTDKKRVHAPHTNSTHTHPK